MVQLWNVDLRRFGNMLKLLEAVQFIVKCWFMYISVKKKFFATNAINIIFFIDPKHHNLDSCMNVYFKRIHDWEQSMHILNGK